MVFLRWGFISYGSLSVLKRWGYEGERLDLIPVKRQSNLKIWCLVVKKVESVALGAL